MFFSSTSSFTTILKTSESLSHLIALPTDSHSTSTPPFPNTENYKMNDT